MNEEDGKQKSGFSPWAIASALGETGHEEESNLMIKDIIRAKEEERLGISTQSPDLEPPDPEKILPAYFVRWKE